MIEIVELKSSVKLILDKMDSVRSVSVGIWCNNGSVFEAADEQGISHFIEHMLFKGTDTRSTFEIVNEIDRLGGQMNAFTSKEVTCYYVKALDEHFDAISDVLTDMVEHPKFDAAEIDREKGVVIEEINMNADDPDDVALDMFERVVFEGTGMAHPVLGTKETVSAFTHDKVSDYYYSHYTRDAIVVSVAGSFDREHVIEYFEAHFTSLKATREPLPQAAPELNVDSVEINKDVEQAHIAMGLATIPITDERKYALSVINNLMGGGMSSRLFQNVRENKGLAYSIVSVNGFYSHTGAFCICAGIARDKLDEAMDAIKYEIQKLADEPVGLAEFESAREQLKASVIFSQESVQQRMVSNGRSYYMLGKCLTQAELLAKYDALTLADIEQTKHLISDYDNYTIVNVMSQR